MPVINLTGTFYKSNTKSDPPALLIPFGMSVKEFLMEVAKSQCNLLPTVPAVGRFTVLY